MLRLEARCYAPLERLAGWFFFGGCGVFRFFGFVEGEREKERASQEEKLLQLVPGALVVVAVYSSGCCCCWR